MFNKNFYPTPQNIIEKMLEPYFSEDRYLKLSDKVILEPSAGKGDILNYIQDKTYNSNHKLYCIESNVELQAILKDKGYDLIDIDFLTHSPDFNYNLIIMNPPFENGDEHLLKAWEILNKGEIVCLLNSETIKNPYSRKRQLLKNIIDENGTIEFLGDCFADSERKTGVDVALVRLKKESDKDEFKFEFSDKDKIEFNDEFIENSVATRDVLNNICIQYEQIKKDYSEMMKYKNKIRQYANSLTGGDWEIESNYHLKEGSEEHFMKFVCDLKAKIWENIANKTNLQKYMTARVSQDFNSYLHQQSTLGITKENIFEFVNIIFQNRFNILDKAIEEVFDIFTKYHEENRCHIEGWKTNDKWKVNKKIVLPYWVRWGEYSSADSLRKYGDNFRTCYDREYADIDKAMAYIAGDNYDHILTIGMALENKFNKLGKIYAGDKFDNNCQSTFFNIKFFKKGTVHLEFKDEWLWKEFNIRACLGKNWLPEAEKKAWEKSKENKEQPKLLLN